MIKIFDEINKAWVWLSSDQQERMSPLFYQENDALDWRLKIAQEHASEYDSVRYELDQLTSGESIVVPKNKTHAENMLRMAHFYIEHNKPKENENETGTN